MDDDFERFATCANAYGADAQRWPPADRALHARLGATAEGAAVLAAAARTDDFLDAWEPAPASADLAARIGAATLPGAAPRHRRFVAWSAAAFAASAVFGFVVGFSQVLDDGDAELLAQIVVGPAGGGLGL